MNYFSNPKIQQMWSIYGNCKFMFLQNKCSFYGIIENYFLIHEYETFFRRGGIMFNFKHFQTFSKYTLCVTFPAKKMLQVRFGERTRFFDRKLIFLDL